MRRRDISLWTESSGRLSLRGRFFKKKFWVQCVGHASCLGLARQGKPPFELTSRHEKRLCGNIRSRRNDTKAKLDSNFFGSADRRRITLKVGSPLEAHGGTPPKPTWVTPRHRTSRLPTASPRRAPGQFGLGTVHRPRILSRISPSRQTALRTNNRARETLVRKHSLPPDRYKGVFRLGRIPRRWSLQNLD